MVLITLVLHYTSLVLYKLTGFNWILDSRWNPTCHHWHEKPLCLYTVYSFEATLFYVKNFSCILFKLRSLISGVKGLSAGLHKASIPACPLGRQLSVTFCLFCDHFLLVLYWVNPLSPKIRIQILKLISIHFLTELVQRICSKIKIFSLRWSFYSFS